MVEIDGIVIRLLDPGKLVDDDELLKMNSLPQSEKASRHESGPHQ
jgi:hypothetical protein